jgi:hypothetical protein
MNMAKLTALVHGYPMDMRYHDAGVTIFGVPIGDNSYVTQFLEDKFDLIDCVLTLIQKMAAICDMLFEFHAHRLSAQAYPLVHVLRLTPPTHTLPRLPRFDAAQLRRYEKLSSVSLGTRAAVLVSRPIRYQGHGFVPTCPLLNRRLQQVSLTLRPIVHLSRGVV